MKMMKLLPAFAVLALSGCVTGYGYNDGYYYGRPTVGVGTYGGVYGTSGWRYGYGAGYGSPGYYGGYGGSGYYGGYYPPYGGYYNPYGHYPRPPVVVVPRPPGGHHDNDGHGHGNQGSHRPPPWRDLNGLGNRGPTPLTMPDSRIVNPSRGLPPMPHNSGMDTPRGIRMPSPSISSPPRMRMPEPPSMPSRVGAPSSHNGDSRR